MYMKMKKVLLFISVLIYCVFPIQAQNIHTKIGKFPIGVMSADSTYKRGMLSQFINTNINFIHISTAHFTNEQILEICDTSVLKVLIDNNRFEFSQDTFTYNHNNGINFLDSLGHHSSILGYFYIDEPNIAIFHKMSQYSQDISDYDSTFAHTANLLPMYADKYRIAENINDSFISADSASYSAYIDSFVAICNPTFLMFDHYPIMGNYKTQNSSLWPRDFFMNLDIISRKSEEYNMPFMYVAAIRGSKIIASSSGSKRFVDFKYVLNSALVYGAKGIMY